MRLTIRTKLLGGFSLVLLMMGVIAILGIMRLNQAAQRTDDMYTQNVQGVQYALLTNQNMIASAREEKRAFLTPAGPDRDALIQQSRDEMQAAEDAMHLYEGTFASAEDEQQWSAIEAEIVEVIALRETVLDLLAQDRVAEAQQAAAGMNAAIARMNTDLTEAGAFNAQIAEEAVNAAAAAASSARTIMLAISGIALASGLGIAFWLARSISAGVGKMRAAAEGISQGDLDQDVEVSTNDEIGDMARAFAAMKEYLSGMAAAAARIADGDLTVSVRAQSERDALGNAFVQMADSLNDVLSRARHTAEELARSKAELESVAEQAAQATSEIARSSTQVAQGTGDQAAAVQDISSNVNDLSVVIGHVTTGAERQSAAVEEAAALSERVAEASARVAANAQAASSGAENTTAAATEGANRVHATVEGITRLQARMDTAANEIQALGSRSQEIGKIVAVIEDVAEQTNLLALNAAIEAARAGDQGRGFAVVADEVGELAERVAAATKEIASLIESVQSGLDSSVHAMADGVTEMRSSSEAAEEAGQALARILDAVNAVSGQIGDIAAGAEDLKDAGAEMSERIQAVGNVAGENRLAAERMAEQASTVSDAISSIAAVAEENSAATEEVSASAEEMSAQVEQLSASTNELGHMADALLEQIAAFSLRDGGRAEVVPLNADQRRAA